MNWKCLKIATHFLLVILLFSSVQEIESSVDERGKEHTDNEDSHKHKHHHHKWDYSRKGQENWQHQHSDCGGEGQSPIKISTKHAVPAPFPALEMVGYHNPLLAPVTLTNNGHSVSLSAAKPNDEDEPIPYIFGGPLKGEYEMVGLHFHWGRRNNRGSEHIINSIRFAMELHIIHRNRKYKTLEEALNHRDGLSVLAFFFSAGERGNARLDVLIQSLPSVKNMNDKVTLDQPLPLAWMLPRDIDTFYSYRGSLTTPPCSEAVTWILFPHPLHVSFEQMDLFRKLSFGEEPMVDNFRHPQPISGRTIYIHRLVNGTRFHHHYHRVKKSE
ncbi:Hypothetical predicted protein [Cloeon dipterum]|uniref:Carbonic anhydrase n=1 Tax=Cloeon dipterum TaxID=197152 RepID=A0A8S1CWV3_9INSE|nr:Hypothetical predicted protein [Cloeon dipterum]